MASSVLTYGISRNYPYRFFTPLVIAGALAFLVLFSFINYASSAFALVVQYTTSPNATVNQDWFDGAPRLPGSKMSASCQSSPIGQQTRMLTTNNALYYTLTSVESSNGTLLPSLVYLNNPLQDCLISEVAVITGSHQRTAAQAEYSVLGVSVQASTTCTAELYDGPVRLNLTAEWDPAPASVTMTGGHAIFLGRDPTSRASLYWGESLLVHYRLRLIQESRKVPDANFSKAQFSFVDGGFGKSVTDLGHFNVSSSTSTLRTNERGEVSYSGRYETRPIDEVGDLPDSEVYLAADNLAKSFKSVVMTDLGQIDAEQNIIQNGELLQYFTSNFKEFAQFANSSGLARARRLVQSQSGLATQDYDSLKNTTGELRVDPSTLAFSYVCSVPQRKPWSELVISVLVADLVFMSALWKVFNLVMNGWVTNRDETRNWCEGCVKAARLRDDGKMGYSATSYSPGDAMQPSNIPLLRVSSRTPHHDGSG